ncbi:TylF/MycF/NovP-related O-methyltransferase [Chitinophaga sp. XS-30]|uniref:TylF/MycF/NovP-related O-methyltransferase n=1 Tax=Chitinophaga sp. XS-30 TaxID=2604421 RepID=UPI0011DD2F76|nr:TylF/MycF/NovP-related O-methyltransferase [Chitinophaga sp. XS-30]QEH42095.1 macrocin O-methyltransferase [Chitinophaga sp. XS-30]
MNYLKKIYRSVFPETVALPADFDNFHREITEKVKPYTMTSAERVFSLVEAVRYVNESGITGDIVECGVWKGGSMLAVAETLVSMQDTDRTLYMYDTFGGMPEPEEVDRDFRGEQASAQLERDTDKEASVVWAYANLATVQATMGQSSYPEDKIRYVAGKVEETIPETLPERIALLRLDTDWYSSTKHELIHLFPRLEPGGILIIDDYGHWKGARQAVDEYFAETGIRIFLGRIDETGRIAIKQ